MKQERDPSTLQRKAEVGRPMPDTPPITAERALAQALPRAAQDLYELPLQMRKLREARMTLADLPELLEPLSLIALIEGPGEALGLIALPPETLSVLIEVQTMGCLGRAAVVPRKPTRVDAAMVADFVDAVLEGVEAALEPTAEIVWAGGFRYSSYLDDPRPLGLMLEDVSYRVWTLEMGFGVDGGRTGALLWAVPANGRGERLRQLTETAAPKSTPELAARQADWARQMEATVMGTQVVLEAVLHRVTLPLSAVIGFAEGTELPLPADSLETLSIEGVGRRCLALARLGQHSGQRAVRLMTDTASEVPSLRPKSVPFKADDSPPGIRGGKQEEPVSGSAIQPVDEPRHEPKPSLVARPDARSKGDKNTAEPLPRRVGTGL